MKFFPYNKGKSSHFHNQTSFVSKSFKKAANHCAACLYLLGKFDAFTDRRESYTWKNVSLGGGGLMFRKRGSKRRASAACHLRKPTLLLGWSSSIKLEEEHPGC